MVGSWESDVLHQAKKWNEMFLVLLVSHLVLLVRIKYILKNSAAIIWGDFWGWFFHKGFCSKWPSFGFGVA